MCPFTFYIGRLCEEFPGRFPTEVVAEMGRLPAGFLDELIEMRAFAATWQQLDAASDKSKVPESMMRTVVERVMEHCADEDMAEADGG